MLLSVTFFLFVLVAFAQDTEIEVEFDETLASSEPVLSEDGTKVTFDDIEIEILVPGECDESEQADNFNELSVHYTATLAEDGTEFDNSYERGTPVSVRLGTGQIQPAWEYGLIGMCKGEKRRLTVPPHHAFGEKGAGEVVPPNAVIIYEMEVIDIQKNPVPAQGASAGNTLTDVIVLVLMIITSIGGAYIYHLNNKKKGTRKVKQPPKAWLKKARKAD